MAQPFTKQVRAIARGWSGRLQHYRAHHHDEHREALVEEALRFVGLQLENNLSYSEYWASAGLMRRVTVLLYLVDRGVVNRRRERHQVFYEAAPDAECWVARQRALAAHLIPTFELLAALRHHQARRLLHTPSR